ncbi:uncharacterized protein N7469_009871 [Penicillium citrinum]|uniref:Rhodopsin domain-containing protein n=2 Tax=Penicillium TaxID=5073 RepID=A0A9W9TFZ7_PENCI|nr:uncharacterized protein N7469_009871 [Penicillium citrinum]KAJ5220984.1 hypothetical protein N7469_009871 [Penicillium citrinum]KAJ5595952.1 hypothetical protein N7450_002410 [Penicillium hetheringtonii]
MDSQKSSDHTWTDGDFEHPNQQLRWSITIGLVFAFMLPTVAVALRFMARRVAGRRLYLDDWLILVALVFKYGCSIGVTTLLYNGLGSHIDTIPPKNLTWYLKVAWANNFVYPGCIGFIKLSILALYRRIFSTKKMNYAVNTMAFIVVIWTIGNWIAGTINCLPVARFWDRSLEGACMDLASFSYGQQIPNIVSDAIILAMPLGMVWSLPISKQQKLLLSGVFVVGGLTLIFDCIRLWRMIILSNAGPDITYHQAPVVLWTCVESAVGIVAACLPNLRPLFKTGGPGFWSQLRSRSKVSGKSHLNTNTTTTTTSTNPSLQKGPLDSHALEEGIEVHRYSDIIREKS